MFGLFGKPPSPEEKSKQLAAKFLAQTNDCANDIRIMWKGKDPCSLFPQTMQALSALGSFLSRQGAGPFTSWAGSSGGDSPSAYDQGAIESLVNSHIGHLTKIVDKHERECAKNSVPTASFLPEFVSFVSSLKESVSSATTAQSEDSEDCTDVCAKYVVSVTQSINDQAPMMIDQITRLDGATTDGKRVVVYDYTVTDHSTAQTINWAAAETGLRQAQLDMIKADRDFLGVVKAGVETRYRYRDSNGNSLLEFVINSSHL